MQVVLQVRVNPHLTYMKRQGTLKGAHLNGAVRADPHYSNTELEWVLSALPGTHLSADSVVVNGIMLRVTDEHPRNLPCTQWWPENKQRSVDRMDTVLKKICEIM